MQKLTKYERAFLAGIFPGMLLGAGIITFIFYLICKYGGGITC